MKSILHCAALFSLMLSLHGHAEPWQQERAVYQQAITAIQGKQTGDYAISRRLLKNYPLLPYLDYEYLAGRFDTLPEKQIRTFLERYPDTFIARRLYVRWLNYLGQQQNWPLFEAFYQADQASDSHQCYQLEARLVHSDNNQAVMAQISLFWLKPYSLPKACDRVLATWQQQGQLNSDLAWQRFQASFAEGNTRLARYLIRYLDASHQQLAQQLMQPERFADVWLQRLADNNPLNSAVSTRLLRSLSRYGHHQQVAELVSKKPQWLNADDLLELQQVSAWHLARNADGSANRWLSAIDADTQPQLTEYQLRYAMQDKNWLLYQKLFNRFASQVQDDDEWLYWYAVAQQQSGIADDNDYFRSDAIFKRLAERRSFYGFLVAEQQQQPLAIYRTQAEPSTMTDDSAVNKKLALALELYHIGQLTDANREWYYATRSFSADQWQQAGLLAHQAQWHDKTIQAFASAGQWHAIDQRFPLAWQELFYQQSRKHHINQSWLLAMARQESGFSPQAQSAAGAMGVLQLMPDTAKRLAHQMNTGFSTQKLLEPAYNITLGSQYLKDMLARFDNNYILATAAYNAGPARVNEWLKERPLTDDWVHWIATIPYRETRDYVKNILTYSRIYQARLGSEQAQLSMTLPKS